MRAILLLLVFHGSSARNFYRKKEADVPEIKVSYTSGNPDPASLSSFFLQEFPIFKIFNEDYFFKHYLPDQVEVNNKKIDSEDVSKRIENLLEEIAQNKQHYTDFKILKKSFNRFKKHGFLVLKFKDLPLVCKIFIETPYSLTHPYEKVFEERGIFTMGGANRYFLGFTRIPNNELLRQRVGKDKVTTPNKWYWLPKDVRWIKIDGENLGGKAHQEITCPATYALICEEVTFKESNPNGTAKKYLDLCTNLEYIIDPHPANCKIRSKHKKAKALDQMQILDTEHFPTLFGAYKKIKPSNKFTSWYVKVGGVYLKAGFLTSKRDKRANQLRETYYKLYAS